MDWGKYTIMGFSRHHEGHDLLLATQERGSLRGGDYKTLFSNTPTIRSRIPFAGCNAHMGHDLWPGGSVPHGSSCLLDGARSHVLRPSCNICFLSQET